MKHSGAKEATAILAALAAGLLCGCVPGSSPGSHWGQFNDVHSGLNPTLVDRVVQPRSLGEIQETVAEAQRTGRAVSIAGGRHGMGGQQFGTDTTLIDMTTMNRVLDFDRERGVVEVEAGMEWPDLMDYLAREQEHQGRSWSIIQKQFGADRFTVGGSLASNIHGSGLDRQPIGADVESFILVDPDGRLRKCSLHENPDLYALAIGGYGLFGVIGTVKLRLAPRTRMEQVVGVLDVEDLVPAFRRSLQQGCVYGVCRLSTDPASDGFLRRGLLTCYRPVDPDTPVSEEPASWLEWERRKLHVLSHTDPGAAFDMYVSRAEAGAGSVLGSDALQRSSYLPNYHEEVDEKLAKADRGGDMMTELYVPRDRLAVFLNGVRGDLLQHEVQVVSATVRVVRSEEVSFLAWAREDYACLALDIHVPHRLDAREKAVADFQRLIERALAQGGTFSLAFHRWATREQIQTGHPHFLEFLRRKIRYDPQEVFQSSWYRHYKYMFADVL